jgi:hypothetical protein
MKKGAKLYESQGMRLQDVGMAQGNPLYKLFI